MAFKIILDFIVQLILGILLNFLENGLQDKTPSTYEPSTFEIVSESNITNKDGESYQTSSSFKFSCNKK